MKPYIFSITYRKDILVVSLLHIHRKCTYNVYTHVLLRTPPNAILLCFRIKLENKKRSTWNAIMDECFELLSNDVMHPYIAQALESIGSYSDEIYLFNFKSPPPEHAVADRFKNIDVEKSKS